MYESDSINLLRAKTRFSPKLTAIGKELHRVSLVLTSIVTVIGLFTTVSFIVLRIDQKEHAEVKRQMEQAILAETKKEGLYLSVQDRLHTIYTLLSQQFSWASAVQTILSLGNLSEFSSLAITDKQDVTFRMDADSFDAVRSVMSHIVDGLVQKTIKTPRLTSFDLDQDGKLHMSLSLQLQLTSDVLP